MSEKEEKSRDLTMKEIGRLGGQTTASRYGTEHFQELGRRGGEKTKARIKAGREAEKTDA